MDGYTGFRTWSIGSIRDVRIDPSPPAASIEKRPPHPAKKRRPYYAKLVRVVTIAPRNPTLDEMPALIKKYDLRQLRDCIWAERDCSSTGSASPAVLRESSNQKGARAMLSFPTRRRPGGQFPTGGPAQLNRCSLT